MADVCVGVMPEYQARIRTLARAHREAAAALFAAAHPERADEPAGWGAPSGPAGPRRYVAVTGAAERIVGYGGFWPVRPGKFRIDLVVAPGHRRCGIGSRLLDRLTGEAHAASAVTVQARADSNRAQSLAFLQHRGFSETMRMHHLVLDVANADLRPFAGIERRLAADGIVLTTLAEERGRTGVTCTTRHVRAGPTPTPAQARRSRARRRRSGGCITCTSGAGRSCVFSPSTTGSTWDSSGRWALLSGRPCADGASPRR